MSNRSEIVTPELLRSWGLPDPGMSKKTRGRVIVVGGSRRTPGAVVLAGESALRVGAGRLGVLVPRSVDAQLGAVIPEAAVFALPDEATDPLTDDVANELTRADAVLVGPGFDDPEETRATLTSVAGCGIALLVLDAYALGILPQMPRDALPAQLVLNANIEEAAILLGRDLADDRTEDLREIADRYRAVVHCYGDVISPEGDAWHITADGSGLGTSGSGDVLAGAITGFAGRGMDLTQAVVWGAWAHATAGERLTRRHGVGFLARQIPPELTAAVHELFESDTELNPHVRQ